MPLRIIRYPKRSQHFYLRGSVRGQNVFETTGTSERSAAEAIRIKRESELLNRSIFGPGETVTFAEAAVSYLSEGGEARFLAPVSDKLARWKLKAITQEVADRTAVELYPNASNATRLRQVYAPLCAVLIHAFKKGWTPKPTIKRPAVKRPVTTWSTPERLGKLVEHTTGQLRRFLFMDAYTGARLSEILRVDWDEDVNLSLRSITFRRTKNGEMRTAYIPDPLLIELSGVPAAERHGRMFQWTAQRSVYAPLRRACARAGVEYLPPHQQGRHTYATWMRTFGGLDLIGLKEAGGWKSIQSVMRYVHVTPNESAKAAQRLPPVHFPCTDDAEPVKALKRKRKS
jgi:integrase